MTIAATEHVRRLPKVELHCHIEGASRAATIKPSWPRPTE